jgi:hypothetical protein
MMRDGFREFRFLAAAELSLILIFSGCRLNDSNFSGFIHFVFDVGDFLLERCGFKGGEVVTDGGGIFIG